MFVYLGRMFFSVGVQIISLREALLSVFQLPDFCSLKGAESGLCLTQGVPGSVLLTAGAY